MPAIGSLLSIRLAFSKGDALHHKVYTTHISWYTKREYFYWIHKIHINKLTTSPVLLFE